MNSAFDVTVIIVNHNGGAYLGRCLAALRQQTTQPRQVVVVDNGSTDDSLNDLESCFPEVSLIRFAENLGFAAANNRVVASTDTEWIILLNPDAFPSPTWLEQYHHAARTQKEYASFCCRMLKADDPTKLDGLGDCYHTSGIAWRRYHNCPEQGRGFELREVFSACAAAALYNRQAFLEVGGFDEHFFCYMEDIDLGYRLQLAGFKCLYVPSAQIYHVGSGLSGRRSDFSVYYGHRNLVWTYVKNMPGFLFWLYLPQHLFVNISSIIWLSLRNQGKITFLAKKDALWQIRRVWRQRRQIQKNRRARIGEIRRLMSRSLIGFLCSCG